MKLFNFTQTNMWKCILLIILLIILSGCEAQKASAKRAIEYGSKAFACIAVRQDTCVAIGLFDGWLDGNEKAKEQAIARKNEKLIKAIADKQAKDAGVVVGECYLFDLLCTD